MASRSWSAPAKLAVVLASGILLSLTTPPAVDAKGDVYENFIDEVVTDVQAMSGAFAPNPRNGGKPMMILNSKMGEVHILEDPDNSNDAVQILDLSGDRVCEDGERGLHTVIPHPDFNTDGNYWLYAFYTAYKEGCLEDSKDGPWNVVARFKMDPVTLKLDYDDGREEIWRGTQLDPLKR
jgi:Glucose / Sorbosone dehydrogenase